MKNKFKNFYEAWWYLNETKVFKLKKNENSFFYEGLCIDVQKVNPKTSRIEDDEELNTKVEVWLECGEPFYENQCDMILNYHNSEYDTGGDTFEEAIINLANIVWGKNKR